MPSAENRRRAYRGASKLTRPRAWSPGDSAGVSAKTVQKYREAMPKFEIAASSTGTGRRPPRKRGRVRLGPTSGPGAVTPFAQRANSDRARDDAPSPDAISGYDVSSAYSDHAARAPLDKSGYHRDVPSHGALPRPRVMPANVGILEYHRPLAGISATPVTAASRPAGYPTFRGYDRPAHLAHAVL